MTDVLIVGGGVIGLSVAWELAQRGAAVTVLERAALGQESSWAGAGLIPPSTAAHDAAPLKQLVARSAARYPSWSERLQEIAGIDIGYRRCGAIYVYRDDTAAAHVARLAERLELDGVEHTRVEPAEIENLEPALTAVNGNPAPVRGGVMVPGEAQIRSPWHLAALAQACRSQGVRLIEQAAVTAFEIAGGRVRAAVTPATRYACDSICLTGGAWSGPLAAQLGLQVPIRPVRGQIVLLGGGRPLLTRIVNEGPRYLLPREDGRVLVGSTMEEVGFDKRTTQPAIDDLVRLAGELAPPLAGLNVEKCWAGLRPATPDGMPLLGRIPTVENAWIAAGHFRLGLTLAPATGESVAALIAGEMPPLPLAEFSADRFL